jgi:hypothetical protein
MDEHIYSKSTIKSFLNENLFFKDPKLKKYFERDEMGDLGKFRSRVKSDHSDRTFEKMMYVLVTDSIRDIILDTIGEITEYMKIMGDLIISGGEAYNLYTKYDEHIVTSDIDAKFVPRLPVNTKFFGKLQAIKLLLWNKLGKVAKRLNLRVKNRILFMKSTHPKLFKYLGVGFKGSGPYVTRRYTLIKKKKSGTTNKHAGGDVFIDVELFALDLNVRYFSPKSGKIENNVMGGILDIPFMRPKEFGYEVVLSKRKGVTYRDVITGKLITNNKIYVASKEFLIEDIYLMHKLNLRPEKREKDRKRLIKLSKLFDKNIPNSLSIDNIFSRIKPKLIRVRAPDTRKNGYVPINRAKQVNPYNYKNFTTKPSEERLSKQLVHGLKPVTKDTKINGYENSSGNKRFNLKTLTWRDVKNNSYVKNEFRLRPVNALPMPENINIKNTLYGYRSKRNDWIPKEILDKAAAIPFVGLKK